MSSSRSSLLVGGLAIMLVIGVTVVQGTWTERWGEHGDRARLDQAARLLEEKFPKEFGGWRFDRDMTTSPQELERAGAVGSIARVFRHVKTKTPVSAFVVCATPYDASGHTPDRCYPGAGFEIAEPEHRLTVPLRDGGEAEAYTGTFRKIDQTLRVFWTYGVDAAGPVAAHAPAPAGTPADAVLRWVAPQIARIALNEEPTVYKLYAIVDQTKLTGSQATYECTNFLGELLPAFDAALAGREPPADGAADAPGAGAAEPQAEAAADAAVGGPAATAPAE